MTTKRDYYEILGVERGASEAAIKQAYRRLVMQHHPDRVPPEKKPAAEEQFKEISEAYAVLSDSQKRAVYDQYGHAGFDQRYSTEDIFRGADFSSIFGDLGLGGSIFEDLFGAFGGFGAGGRGPGRRRSGRGADLELRVTISLEEAYRGVEREVEIPRLESCGACHGHGTEKGKEPSRCERCGGAGQLRVSRGFFVLATTCGTCGGTGHVIKHPCPECRGQGRLERTRRLKVKIPPGVDTGSRLRLSGEGEGGVRGGGRGDLYVTIIVAEHEMFSRHGDDLLYEAAISFPTATLGGEVEVPTLNGPVEMKIPTGTPPGRIFRLRGKGMPRLGGGGRGDQLVRVTISVPERLTPQQRELLKQLDATLGNGRQASRARSFTEKVKEVFR